MLNLDSRVSSGQMSASPAVSEDASSRLLSLPLPLPLTLGPPADSDTRLNMNLFCWRCACLAKARSGMAEANPCLGGPSLVGSRRMGQALSTSADTTTPPDLDVNRCASNIHAMPSAIRTFSTDHSHYFSSPRWLWRSHTCSVLAYPC